MPTCALTASTPGALRRSPAAKRGVSAAESGRARAVFFGSGGFAVPILNALAEAPETDLVAVMTAPPRPAGRRAELTPTPVALRAAALGLPVFTPERLRTPDALAVLADLRADFGILSDYGKILPQAVLDLTPHGILNLHPSLLPRHRGATPIPATILAGDTETGVALFRMDAGMDSGDLLAEARVPLDGSEETPGLEPRLAAVAATLLRSNLAPWLAGDLVAVPQPATGVTTTRPLRREDGRLSPTQPAVELERAVRAYRPWPGTFLEIPGVRVAVLDAAVAPSATDDEPGTLVVDAGVPALATVAGRLRLVRVRPAGGSEMDGAAWLRGRPGVLGARVG